MSHVKIPPTIGRVLWFRSAANDKIEHDSIEPLCCMIVGLNKRTIEKWKNLPESDGTNKSTVEKLADGPPVECEAEVVVESINIAGYDRLGKPFDRQEVPIYDGGDERPAGGYCEWMPYQQGQAAKHANDSKSPMTPSDVQSNLKTLFSQFNDMRANFAKQIESYAKSLEVLADSHASLVQTVDKLCADLGEEKPQAESLGEVVDQAESGFCEAAEAFGTGDAGATSEEKPSKPISDDI